MLSQSYIDRALTIAASENNMDDAAKAINLGANPNYTDQYGFTAALYFADYGNVDGVIMIFELAKKFGGTPSYSANGSATQTQQINRHGASPAILLMRRGDVDAVLKLAELEPKILTQPVLKNLVKGTGITLDKVVRLLKAGFITDDQFEPHMRELNISMTELLNRIDQVA